ncbi:MAG: ABC transporter ATP-binding protein [Treponema sp.]
MPPVKVKGVQKPRDAKKTVIRLLGYTARRKTLWFFVFVCTVCSAAGGAAASYMIKPALNDIILPLIGRKNPDFSHLRAMLCALGVVCTAGAASSWAVSRLMLRISTSLIFAIRTDLQKKLLSLPVRFHDKKTHGDLMSLFTNDTDTLRDMMSQSLPQLVSSVLTVAIVFAMMMILSPALTLLAAVSMTAMTLLMRRIAKKSSAAFRRQQSDMAALNGYIEEMIDGQKVVRIFSYEDESKSRFAVLNDALCRSGTEALSLSSRLFPLTTNLSHVQYAVIAAAAAYLVIAGRLDLGSAAAFLQYTRSFSQPFSMISQLAVNILNALAGAERIFTALDETAEDLGGKTALVNAYRAYAGEAKERRLVQSFLRTGEWAWKNPEDKRLVPLAGEVVFDRVDFGYTPRKTILFDVCIHAKSGQKIALVGSTGSGKTTITNLLMRFYDVPERCGRITLDGIPLNSIAKDDLRRSFGMVLQDTHLFTGTIADNIRYGNLNASEAEVIAAARLANADGFISRLKDGYRTQLTGDGEPLSQGQRQLLSIARAAAANPPVLILDEATSSIDTRTESLIQRGMDGLMKGRTVFVIAHRLSTVRNADEIIVLDRGRVIERGTHDFLLARGGHYYRLYQGNL